MQKYRCTDCQWQGEEDQLDCETVESCMGSDELEVCPQCGSMNIVMLVD